MCEEDKHLHNNIHTFLTIGFAYEFKTKEICYLKLNIYLFQLQCIGGVLLHFLCSVIDHFGLIEVRATPFAVAGGT